MPVVIIDNYDSFTYNLYQLVRQLCSKSVLVFRNDELTFDELKLHQPSHVILSPGPGHPANLSDFGICSQVVSRHEELRNAAILGVCLGHQGIVHHLGGTVVRAPEIVHGKQSEMSVTGTSVLFDRIHQTFKAMRYHSLIAEEITLPACLQVTARDLVRGLIMAVAHKTAPIHGIQFHPESIGTPVGRTIMENFLAL